MKLQNSYQLTIPLKEPQLVITGWMLTLFTELITMVMTCAIDYCTNFLEAHDEQSCSYLVKINHDKH